MKVAGVADARHVEHTGDRGAAGVDDRHQSDRDRVVDDCSDRDERQTAAAIGGERMGTEVPHVVDEGQVATHLQHRGGATAGVDEEVAVGDLGHRCAVAERRQVATRGHLDVQVASGRDALAPGRDHPRRPGPAQPGKGAR
jgi:hypothetical protein